MMESGTSPGGRPDWPFLSRRELATLAVAVGAVLLAVAAVKLIERAWPRGDVRIMEAGDLLPTPARLDLNTARDFELATLPGIGPKTATAIVEYREQHGPFADWGDLTKVKGVGPATVERVRPHAMIAPPRGGAGPREH